jgi:hypothetical protein
MKMKMKMKMKKIIIILGLTLLTLGSLNAQGMKCGSGKYGASMKSDTYSSLSKMHIVDGYDVGIASKKPLIVGNN